MHNILAIRICLLNKKHIANPLGLLLYSVASEVLSNDNIDIQLEIYLFKNSVRVFGGRNAGWKDCRVG